MFHKCFYVLQNDLTYKRYATKFTFQNLGLYLVDLRCFIRLYLFANGFLHSGQNSPSPVPTNGTGVPEAGTTVPVVDEGATCIPVFVATAAAGVT